MPESIGDRIYRMLHEAIRTQRLTPNTMLQEADLAARFQVSRTPIREATQRLIQDGLIERRGTSFVIRQLSVEEVANIYPIISVLEGLAARLAAERIKPEELDKLAAYHAAMLPGVSSQSSDFIAANQQFHDAIIAAAQNPPLAREIERFRLITIRFRQAVLSMGPRQAQSVAEHDQLLHALQNHDGGAAEAAMRIHVRTAEEVLMALLRASQMIAPFPVPEQQNLGDALPAIQHAKILSKGRRE